MLNAFTSAFIVCLTLVCLCLSMCHTHCNTSKLRNAPPVEFETCKEKLTKEEELWAAEVAKQLNLPLSQAWAF